MRSCLALAHNHTTSTTTDMALAQQDVAGVLVGDTGAVHKYLDIARLWPITASYGPRTITATTDGMLYLACPSLKEVLLFCPDDGSIRARYPLGNPVDVAVTHDGARVFVADSERGVLELDRATFQLIKTIDNPHEGLWSCAVDRHDNLYVLRSFVGTITKYNRDGVAVQTIKNTLHYPVKVIVSDLDDSIYVVRDNTHHTHAGCPTRRGNPAPSHSSLMRIVCVRASG